MTVVSDSRYRGTSAIAPTPSPANSQGKGSFFLKHELRGIRLARKMEGQGEIGAFPTPLLWPRSAKMARNGADESGRCTSGQWEAAAGGIGRAPAVRFGEGCNWRVPCKGAPIAGRRSKGKTMRGLQRATNARNCRIRPVAGNSWWRLQSRGGGRASSEQGGRVPGVQGYPWHHRPQRGR